MISDDERTMLSLMAAAFTASGVLFWLAVRIARRQTAPSVQD